MYGEKVRRKAIYARDDDHSLQQLVPNILQQNFEWHSLHPSIRWGLFFECMLNCCWGIIWNLQTAVKIEPYQQNPLVHLKFFVTT